MLLGFAGGGLGSVSVAWSGVGLATYALDVHAADVSVGVSLEPLRTIRGRAHGREIAFDGASGARASALRRFLASVRGRDPASVACTPDDALLTLRAVLACEQALETGERVTL